MEIKALTYYDEEIWNRVMVYAENCSWQPTGKFLSNRMKEKDFKDWERVFVALENSEIAGFCALTKTCSLSPIAYMPFIGFVFVGESYRGNRISEKLCSFSAQYAKTIGFDKVYLYSDIVGLYEKYGFTKIDEKKAAWGIMQSIYMRIT